MAAQLGPPPCRRIGHEEYPFASTWPFALNDQIVHAAAVQLQHQIDKPWRAAVVPAVFAADDRPTMSLLQVGGPNCLLNRKLEGKPRCVDQTEQAVCRWDFRPAPNRLVGLCHAVSVDQQTAKRSAKSTLRPLSWARRAFTHFTGRAGGSSSRSGWNELLHATDLERGLRIVSITTVLAPPTTPSRPSLPLRHVSHRAAGEPRPKAA